MTRAEEKALNAYPIIMGTLIPVHDGMPEIKQDCNKFVRKAYINGYNQSKDDFINNLWHDPDEEPEIEHEIIWEGEHFHGKHLGGKWTPKVDCFGRKEKWCYMADILPLSKNVDRPYSRVDYSNGFDKGYRQAVKNAEKWLKEHWREYIMGPDADGCIGFGHWEDDFEEAMEEDEA